MRHPPATSFEHLACSQVLLQLFIVGVNVQVEDDSLGSGDIAETGYQDETGEMRRPWCPATRLLEHRETQAQEAEAEARRKAQQKSYCNPDDVKPVLREDFPSIVVCTSSVCNQACAILTCTDEPARSCMFTIEPAWAGL